MKKQLLTILACTIFMGSALADNESKSLTQQTRVKVQATFKTIADFITIPLVGCQVMALVYNLLPKTTVDFLPSDAFDKVIRGGAAIGVGLAAGIGVSELYVYIYKMFGYSDAEIREIYNESWAQKFWILAQAITLGGAIATVHAAQQEEKERKEREARWKQRWA